MTKTIQKLNKKLRDIGTLLLYPKSLESSNKTLENQQFLFQLEGILEEVNTQKIYFPYQELCETLELNLYEKLLVCMLLAVSQENTVGIDAFLVKERLLPFEKYREESSLAVCFWQENQQIYLSLVSFAFLMGQVPQFPKGVTFQIPKQETCYGRQEILKTASCLFHHKELLEREPCALVFQGKKGSGKHFVAQQLAAQEGYGLLVVKKDAGIFSHREKNELFWLWSFTMHCCV